MKQGIHPNYNKEADIKCACGATFAAGSTDEKIFVEICSQCHPFYTGKQKLVDTAGRVDKFNAKIEAAKAAKAAKIIENAKKVDIVADNKSEEKTSEDK